MKLSCCLLSQKRYCIEKESAGEEPAKLKCRERAGSGELFSVRQRINFSERIKDASEN